MLKGATGLKIKKLSSGFKSTLVIWKSTNIFNFCSNCSYDEIMNWVMEEYKGIVSIHLNFHFTNINKVNHLGQLLTDLTFHLAQLLFKSIFHLFKNWGTHFQHKTINYTTSVWQRLKLKDTQIYVEGSTLNWSDDACVLMTIGWMNENFDFNGDAIISDVARCRKTSLNPKAKKRHRYPRISFLGKTQD